MVEGRHELVCRIEWQLGNTRGVLVLQCRIDPRLDRERKQRAFSRVADELALLQACVGAQGGREQEFMKLGAGNAAFFVQNPAGGDIAFAFDGVAATCSVQHASGHLVQRQRTGLVRADHRGAPERLDCSKLLDDHVAPGHAVHAERQRHRDHGRQALGDRGDGKGDGRHRRRDQVITTHQTGHEHQADHHGGDERETPAQRVELDLQGRRGLGCLCKQPGQAPHFGVHAGRGHHGFDAPPGDHGVHEHHADTFGEGCAAIHRPGGLADRMGLAGQRSLGHFGPMRL